MESAKPPGDDTEPSMMLPFGPKQSAGYSGWADNDAGCLASGHERGRWRLLPAARR